MLYNERAELILQQLQLQSTVKVAELSQLLQVSVDTVRRDLKNMEQEGRIKYVRGGACLPEDRNSFSNFTGREIIHSEWKREAARKALEQVIRAEAKDIRTKYVEPPYTTNFGILFLPFEGLYAEVVNQGMVESLQRDYQVNVAGPSTMAALLNSLQMGFKTLAIQKRSNEVWQVLGAVKTEFEKFDKGLAKLQERLRQSDRELDDLIGTRTRAINRKLRSVQSLDDVSAAALLELDAAPGQPPRASITDGHED